MIVVWRTYPTLSPAIPAVLLLALVCGAAQVHGASLRFEAPLKEPGYWAVPIHLSTNAGESVASLQFDVRLSDAFVDSVGAGARALDAGKQVVLGDHGGHVSLLVAGINQTALGDGTIAWLYIVDDGRASHQVLSELALANPVLASPQGDRVPYGDPTADRNLNSNRDDEGRDDDVAGDPTEEGEQADVDGREVIEGEDRAVFPTSYANGNGNFSGEAEGESRREHDGHRETATRQGPPPSGWAGTPGNAAAGSTQTARPSGIRGAAAPAAPTNRYAGRTHGNAVATAQPVPMGPLASVDASAQADHPGAPHRPPHPNGVPYPHKDMAENSGALAPAGSAPSSPLGLGLAVAAFAGLAALLLLRKVIFAS